MYEGTGGGALAGNARLSWWIAYQEAFNVLNFARAACGAGILFLLNVRAASGAGSGWGPPITIMSGTTSANVDRSDGRSSMVGASAGIGTGGTLAKSAMWLGRRHPAV